MSENFNKIKKKYLTVAIVASCILGACLGIALTCALAVVIKTSGVNFHWAIYIPVALALAAGTGFLFFLILRPNDRRIAKKLDRDFALKQKVQTMVEFAHAEGDMHTLQREQTDEALGEVAKKPVDLKWLLKFLFIPVIALAMLFAGIFTPAKKSAYVEPPYDITDTHETALKNLIAEVEGSSLETGLRTFVVLELSGLLDVLKETEFQSDMKAAVIEAVHNIDALVADADSYLKIDGVLKSYEVVQPFSTAVVNAVVDYKNSPSLSSMNRVKEREKDAEERITNVLNRWKSKYLEEFAPKADGATEGTPLPAEESALKLRGFADALTSGLADPRLERFAPQSGEEQSLARAASAGDALYNAYTALAANLSEHSQSVNGSNDSMYYENINGYLTAFISGSRAALATQSYNCMMDDYLRNVLSRIFGISRTEFGSNADVAPSPTEDENGDDDENKEDGGGYGDGVHKYGSNDQILDPDSGEQKKYSDPVNPDNAEYTFYHKYYDRAMEYINSGKCPNDVAAYIRQYFAYLNNGMEEDKNN